MDDGKISRLGWPNYLPGPRENIFAIGVISLLYGQLENLFSCVFSAATQMEIDQAEVVFRKINNDVRSGIVRQSLRSDLRTDLSECVEHFLKGYAICASNRHDIMHASSGGTKSSFDELSGALVLSKVTKTGQRVCCAPSLDGLREIADGIEAFVLYGAHLSGALAIDENFRGQGKLYSGSLSLTLIEKPMLPRKLRWQPLPKHRSDPFPPPPYLQ